MKCVYCDNYKATILGKYCEVCMELEAIADMEAHEYKAWRAKERRKITRLKTKRDQYKGELKQAVDLLEDAYNYLPVTTRIQEEIQDFLEIVKS